jgi:hypothetical protein
VGLLASGSETQCSHGTDQGTRICGLTRAVNGSGAWIRVPVLRCLLESARHFTILLQLLPDASYFVLFVFDQSSIHQGQYSVLGLP